MLETIRELRSQGKLPPRNEETGSSRETQVRLGDMEQELLETCTGRDTENVILVNGQEPGVG